MDETRTKTRIRPFSNGTQFVDWQAHNCDNCTKFDNDDPEKSTCEIDQALLLAMFSDGSISKEMSERMGFPGSGIAYCWDCPERENRSDIEHLNPGDPCICGSSIGKDGFCRDCGYGCKDGD